MATLLAAVALRHMRRSRDTAVPPLSPDRAVMRAAPDHPHSPFAAMVLPTAADPLNPTNAAAAFMPTASENPTSALFGTTRTGNDGRPRFHAGIDLAPTARDRRGRPMDAVRAVADGRVAYVNRVSGDSNYGVYVVLIHADPVGPVYTLYAHLASVAREVQAGATLRAGHPLGVMGNSANTGLPLVRAHLHFEIGVLLNGRFAAWYRAKRLRPDRGNHHGWNLFAVDPLDVFRQARETAAFSFMRHLETVPTAFELVLAAPRPLDYFRRYPRLWKGPPNHVGAVVLRVSEGGVILAGRPATDHERATLQAVGKPLVQQIDEGVLGRNGMRLVARVNGRWTLGSGAARWLEILTY